MKNFNNFGSVQTTFMGFVSQQIARLSLVFTLILGIYTAGVAQCPCTDCRCSDSLELVKLYNATSGANWINKWDLTKPITTWYGVTLENGRVLNLLLSGNLLIGTIPNLNLPKLRELILSANPLSGTIPNFNLPDLQKIDFSDNSSLNGVIPNFNLPNLELLNLESNNLSGTIPNFILPSLSELNLSYNKLSGTIPNFNLPNLYVLNFMGNKLTGTIPNFSLPNLQSLNFRDNQLSGSIPNFSLPNLVILNLYLNQLTGSIPNFIFPELELFNLSTNQLSGKIPSFNFPLFYEFDVSNNQLSGCIPKEIRANRIVREKPFGNISNNPNLATQSWSNYWNNYEGACSPNAVASVTTTNWRIYPNPAHDVLSIDGLEETANVLIYNVVGSLVLTKQVKDNAIDIGSLPNGIYTARIVSGTKEAARLFVKE